MKRLLTTIASATEVSDELIAALEELSDTVEDINWATEFSLMNGHIVVLEALGKPIVDKSSDTRRLLAMIIAHASQQNSNVQQCFNSANWTSVVLPRLAREEDPQALAALLHACSCMCRECDEGSKAFITSGGMRLLESLLQSDNSARATEKVVQRTLFLVQYFALVGVSSEALITSTAWRMTSSTSAEVVATSAASALSVMYSKSPPVVKAIVKPLLTDSFVASLAAVDASDPRVLIKSTILDNS